MELPHEAVLLRIFTDVGDRWHMEPLYLAIVERARQQHLAGATALRGVVGFGQSGRLHRERALPVRPDQPVVIEIVDTEEKIAAFLPMLDFMMESGLVTMEKAGVLQYGRERAGLFTRLRQSLGHTHDATRP